MADYSSVPRNEGVTVDATEENDEEGIFRTVEQRPKRNLCSLGLVVCSLLSAALIGLLIRLQKVVVSVPSCPSGGTVEHATPRTVTYDAALASMPRNPFHLSSANANSNIAPLMDPIPDRPHSPNEGMGGYIMQPELHVKALAFIADGDLFYCSDWRTSPTAARLTVTVGNVRTPKINPIYPYLIAFTATYQSRRDVYIMDLRRTSSFRAGGNLPVQRLTYFETSVSSVVEWKTDGSALVFAAQSNQVSVRDTRLYEISILHAAENATTTSASPQVLQTTPIPLSQAIDGVTVGGCIYFVRYKQSSWTTRYVGGTAESLWAYCEGEERAVPLTSDYIGTSTSPRVLEFQKRRYLLFISDRAVKDEVGAPPVFDSGPWRATTRNLWAVPLPSQEQLYSTGDYVGLPREELIQLTQVSCQFNGMALREFTVDESAIVLRIGADLYHLEPQQISDLLLRKGGAPPQPTLIPIHVVSDFHEQQERLLKVDVGKHLTALDMFRTNFDTTNALLTLRGQVWVAPVLGNLDDEETTYQGGGQNMPARKYRVIPGSMTGGSIRVLAARHVPPMKDDEDSGRRLALVLATDPNSDTAEHAFYLVEIQASHTNQFTDLSNLPEPFLGGQKDGGSTRDGGLGSVDDSTLTVSPCGRRFAWTDMDDRICVMSTPFYVNATRKEIPYHCLPPYNAAGEPLSGTTATLSWSPGGRYLGIVHKALNQFKVVSIADCGSTMDGEGSVQDIQLGMITQLTPSRFNSYGMYWGKSSFDLYLKKTLSSLASYAVNEDSSTTIYFLSDRDVITDVRSPWGSRAPMPHFPQYEGYLYALPLPLVTNASVSIPTEVFGRTFSGGGGTELFAGDLDRIKKEESSSSPSSTPKSDAHRRLSAKVVTSIERSLRGRRSTNEHESEAIHRALRELADDVANSTKSPFPEDTEIAVDTTGLMQRAYRVSKIPRGKYIDIVGQASDDGSLAVATMGESGTDYTLKVFQPSEFPSDSIKEHTLDGLSDLRLSTCRKFLSLISKGDKIVVTELTGNALSSACPATPDWKSNVVEAEKISLSIWPILEYKQMYSDAWRMLRDYFYDPGMHQVAWRDIHDRYLPLVSRCWKREELDDVMGQMASELSALHVFVYGGEYSIPDKPPLEPASLGATFARAPEWKGYRILEVPERDPDFDTIDGTSIYSPLSNQALRLTGQTGLETGDVIVSINGESVMLVPEINMMIRGMAGESVRLGVLRNLKPSMVEDTVIVVPITSGAAGTLRYDAWEWRTEQLVNRLADQAGISVGYVHMKAMDRAGEDAFTRGFFPSFDKDGLIIDVRHNLGGNIDSWILTTLQRQAWMYWAGRLDRRYGDMDWTEQFAFRGKIVVLVDEHTSSNGEGIARGISELGLGVIVGTRTWGGGIWGSSANRLVDGGIAAAPQWGIFNKKFGWGGGIEATGVSPDVTVDNDPRMSFDGKDEQLGRAISELKKLIQADPMEPFTVPPTRPDMSLHSEKCLN